MSTTVYRETTYETNLKKRPCSKTVRTWDGTGPNLCIDNFIVLQRHFISKVELPTVIDGREVCEQITETIWESYFTDIPCEPGQSPEDFHYQETMDAINGILGSGDFTFKPGPPPIPKDEEGEEDSESTEEGESTGEEPESPGEEPDTPGEEPEEEDLDKPASTDIQVYEEEGIACIDEPPVTTYSMTCEGGRWLVTKTIKTIRRVPIGPGVCKVIETTYTWTKVGGPCEDWMEEFIDEFAAEQEWRLYSQGEEHSSFQESNGAARFAFRGLFAPLAAYVREDFSKVLREAEAPHGEAEEKGERSRAVFLQKEGGTNASLSDLRTLPEGKPVRFQIMFEGKKLDSGLFVYIRRSIRELPEKDCHEKLPAKEEPQGPSLANMIFLRDATGKYLTVVELAKFPPEKRARFEMVTKSGKGSGVFVEIQRVGPKRTKKDRNSVKERKPNAGEG